MKSLDKLWDPYPHSYLRIFLIFSLIHILVPYIQISSRAVISISLYTIFSFFILYLNHILVTLHRGFLDAIANTNVSTADIEGVEATYWQSQESDTYCNEESKKERTDDWKNATYWQSQESDTYCNEEPKKERTDDWKNATYWQSQESDTCCNEEPRKERTDDWKNATYWQTQESDTYCNEEPRKERTDDWKNGDCSKDEELRNEEEINLLLRQALRMEMDEREEEKRKLIVQLQKATDDLEQYKSLLHDADIQIEKLLNTCQID